ncbi:2,3 cyclic-nucleotide 2-phosphodiesterase [Thermodesulfobium narugense DSM 14796]|uniref:Ribonuclease Y n=1 Tax=Thermodesulfobium narugense DSM 14796 TaxID=747365 RepID=M1E484_9BACT|nr:ribonuclease Y [Thermodesulfobium narugense]AEE13802.1 2,3 cyclic-nucleotide 2-phosphodiesterase [Thermodesulfobium narugense DSM 14796]
MEHGLLTIILLILIIIGVTVIFYLYKKTKELRLEAEKLSKEAKEVLQNNIKEAENKKREILLEAKDEAIRLKSEAEREIKERRIEINRLEQRLLRKEENLERKLENLEKKEEQINQKKLQIDELKAKLESLIQEKMIEIERISGLTSEEARNILLAEVEKELDVEIANKVREAQMKIKEESEKKSREILSLAIQRCAVDHTMESTVSVITLPNDDMKGRIIGREGRNIRSFEAETGVELIIDDTPEAVTISSFDPIRREIARRSLEKLILDGRIHPGRIEETVEKSRKELEQEIKEYGEAVCLEMGIANFHPEIVRLIGRLKFRTSYGQNIYQHSIEVAHLAGIMASELGLDAALAKRGGLLHDIGKAVDFEMEGSHALIGADLAKRYKESPVVVNMIAAHHGEVEPMSLEAILVQAADAVSASRPGARRESLETYIKRLENLEKIALSFEGIDKCFAIQAGREIRVIVKPDQIDDIMTQKLARDIAKRIEESLDYPGEIKVCVVREIRSVEYAK